MRYCASRSAVSALTTRLILTEGELTGVSSIMPQKRNPTALNTLRGLIGDVMGEVSAFHFKAHGAPSGMSDYKGVEPQAALQSTARLLDELAATTAALNFNPQRALDEVNADYSATTELADILQRDANVPFRVGHHFASELVTFGRARGLKPGQIKYADAQRIYAEAAHAYGANAKLPLDERTFRRALSAENMVASSRGLGGPQPAEVARTLAAQREQLAKDGAWTAAARQRLRTASANLDTAFERIRSAP
jgi:argininosuccinate lyase